MLSNLLINTISVLRPTWGQDASFGMTAPLVTVYSNVACGIQPANSKVVLLYAQRNIEITHNIFLNRQLAIKNGDIISDGTNAYKVIGFENLAGRNVVWRIDCILYLLPAYGGAVVSTGGMQLG